MKKIACCLAVIFSLISVSSIAQNPETVTASEIYLRLKKLNVLGTVLYVAAHPDDENSRLIAFLSEDRLYRTGYLSMTRGDGGQNLIGDEQGVQLGLIRTQEMLAARRVDHAEQFFTRAFDFGFSKSTDETLKTWGKDKILSDVVWVIRKFQPDVIVTRFPEDSRAGHGHHSASAVLAHEAFAAAADPGRFPEQFKYGVKTWHAKRLIWNSFNFGPNANTTSDDQMKIDVGGYNAVLGKSYGEIAAESRTNHKSQGAALTRTRGQSLEYFSPVAGEPAHTDIMEGIVTSWSRVPGANAIQAKVDEIISTYDLSHPEKSLSPLIGLYQEISKLKAGYWRTQKMRDVQGLIEDCSGLWLEATVKSAYVVQGQAMDVTFTAIDRLGSGTFVDAISTDGFDTLYHQQLTYNKNFFFTKRIEVSQNKPLTQPYWLEEEMSPGSYNVKDLELIGEPQSNPSFEVHFKVKIGGQELTYDRPIRYRFTDPVRGDLYEPLTVLPPVTASTDPSLVVLTDGGEKNFDVRTQDRIPGGTKPAVGLLNTGLLTLKTLPDNANSIYPFAAKPATKGEVTFDSHVQLNLDGKKDTAKELETINYEHIPRIDYFVDTRIKFVIADIKTSGKRIGYIEGAGDKVPDCLSQMGYEVVLLKEKDIIASNLTQFDAIITGVRAFDVHDWLFSKYDILMGYIKAGGNLIVQYNRSNRIGADNGKISPYHFTISNARVTDESAKVDFLIPSHRVLNFPNKITDKDFEGWIQERGIYFAANADQNFQSVLGMNDPGENQQKGSLIIADYGEGKFVYTGLVFFRELPAGVPGAYRLFANIIALNHKKGF
ncbi:MAG TPA: PIG-L family deacetylase [Puia sp.]|nr:PIG-L family deacetylase [Puia sp.]